MPFEWEPSEPSPTPSPVSPAVTRRSEISAVFREALRLMFAVALVLLLKKTVLPNASVEILVIAGRLFGLCIELRVKGVI